MAVNIKELLAEGCLSLCQEKPLKSITVKDLLNRTGVSKQTFYNHFLDKNDLIQYIYETRIIREFTPDGMAGMNFRVALLNSFKRMQEYHTFLKQALLLEGQNCLRDYLFVHCREYDLAWHQKRYGKEPMPDALRFATEYHATASTAMSISWILSDMPVSCEEIAALITDMRSVGMEKLFEDGETKGNPYA